VTMELTRGTRISRVAGTALLASALVAIAGIVFLVLMFSAFAAGARAQGMVFGAINDTLVLISYLLVAPTVVLLHELLRTRWPGWSTAVTACGLAGIAGIVLLQGLLVAGVVTFEQEIGPVMIPFAAFTIWIITTGYMTSRSGLLPRGLPLAVVASLYVGFPVWAWALGRRLQQV
jgi:hypothetical protein